MLLVISSYAFVWFYEKPQRQAYRDGTSIKLQKWNAIKNPSNRYQLLILGSSRGYAAYNPIVMDSVTNLNTYNMCTGSQHIIESVYMLKEILKYQKPTYLICDVYLPSFRTNPDFYHLFANAKFMSNDMIFNEFLDQKILDLVFPVYKYKEYIKRDFKNFANFTENQTKSTPSWIKGYKHSNHKNDAVSIGKFPSILSFSTVNTLSKDKIESYLKEIIALCNAHNVTPIFVRAPYPPSRIKKSSIDETHQYFRDFFSTQQRIFYDLSYDSTIKFTDYDFEDDHHLNSIGAKKTSITLSKLINEQLQRNIETE